MLFQSTVRWGDTRFVTARLYTNPTMVTIKGRKQMSIQVLRLKTIYYRYLSVYII
jgi:hypothetical protein